LHKGADYESNWALACRSCNLHKSAHINYTDLESQTLVRLFHPRLDQWDKHFQIDHEKGLIIGVTPSGRATVACLNMNSEVQVNARRQWMRLGLFP
jgi:hypothetical protein